jgi:hypothetical protein
VVLLPLIPLPNPRVNELDFCVFRVLWLEVFLRVDFRFILIEWVLGTELLAKGSPRGTPTVPKVSLFPRAVFFPTVQAKTGLTSFPNRSNQFRTMGCREGFLSKEVSVALWLLLFRCGKALEVFWVFGEFLDQVGLTGFPCQREAKSNRSGLIGFRNRPDRFGLSAVVSCVFPLRVCCGCWLGLAPRFSSTSVAA